MSKYSEQVRKDAKAAADYIREHGWCQGITRNEKGGVCMYGASEFCGAACGGVYLDEAVREEIGMCVAGWNDKPGRTKEEVLAVFDRIASE